MSGESQRWRMPLSIDRFKVRTFGCDFCHNPITPEKLESSGGPAIPGELLCDVCQMIKDRINQGVKE